MPRTYIDDDVDRSPETLSDIKGAAKDIKSFADHLKEKSSEAKTAPDVRAYDKSSNTPSSAPKGKAASSAASGGSQATAHSASGDAAASSGTAAGGASAAGGAAASGEGAAAGGAGASSAAASGSAAGPIGAAAGAGIGLISGEGGTIKGSGSAAAHSTKGSSGSAKTSTEGRSDKAAKTGVAFGLIVAAQPIAKAISTGIHVVTSSIGLLLTPIGIIMIAIAIMIGTAYHKETTPPALDNEIRSDADRDYYKRMSNSEAYTVMYQRYSECLRQIIQESYNAVLAKAKQMGKTGVYEEGVSSVDDLAGNTLNVNMAKIISIYSVYAGEDAFLPDFRAAAEAAKDTLFTFKTEEVVQIEQIEVYDYSTVQVLVYDAPASQNAAPSAHTETYYLVPGTMHNCADGETVIEEFENVNVKVAIKNDKGVVTGYETKTYQKPTKEPVVYAKGTIEHKGLAVTINPLDEQVVYDIWPVNKDDIAQDRFITNGELIEIYESRILSYLEATASNSSLPTISPIGDAAFDKMAVEINKFITAQNTHGVTYVYGGDNPYTEMDCSSFVSRVFWFSGVAKRYLFPSGNYYRHNCRTLYNACVKYGTTFSDPASLKPGDLIFMTNTQAQFPGQATHIIIYLGNMQTVEMVGAGISVRNYNDRLNSPDWSKYFYAYGRLPEN